MANAPPSSNVYISEMPAEVDEAQVNTIFGAYGKVNSVKVLPGQGKTAALVRFATEEEATWVVDNLNGNIPQGLDTPIQAKYANQYAKGKGKGDDWSPSVRYTPYGGGKSGDSKGWGKSDSKSYDKSYSSWDNSGKGGGKDKGTSKGKGKDKGKESGIKVIKKGLQLADALPGGKWSNDAGALWIGGLPKDTTDLDLYHIFSPFGAIPSAGVRAMLHPEGNCKGFGFVNFLDPNVAGKVIETLNGTELPDGSTLQVKIKAPPKEGDEGKGDKGKGKAESKGEGKNSWKGSGGWQSSWKGDSKGKGGKW